jgi:predicted ribosome quality control (RQC) complex YloA/Tae2 family protein
MDIQTLKYKFRVLFGFNGCFFNLSEMKQRFSALDISASISELQLKLQGLRLANVYDVSPKTFLFKFQKTEVKELLLIESGTRIHSTQYVREKQANPSAFNIK